MKRFISLDIKTRHLPGKTNYKMPYLKKYIRTYNTTLKAINKNVKIYLLKLKRAIVKKKYHKRIKPNKNKVNKIQKKMWDW